MDIASMIIIGLISSSLLFLISGFTLTVQSFMITRNLKKLPKKAPKSKKKRKKWRVTKNLLTKKRKKKVVFSFFWIFFSLVLGLSAIFIIYYRSMNLTAEDEKSVVNSYYLLRDFQSEIDKAATKEKDETASRQNIRYLATSLSAYTSKKASILNTSEGQSTLNRYYASLAQLGLNATRESNNFFGNPTLVKEFQADIEKTITYEKNTFDYFKINQDILKSEGSNNGKE